VKGVGCGVKGVGFRLQGSGFWVWGMVWGLGLWGGARTSGWAKTRSSRECVFRDQGPGFRVQALGVRLQF